MKTDPRNLEEVMLLKSHRPQTVGEMQRLLGFLGILLLIHTRLFMWKMQMKYQESANALLNARGMDKKVPENAQHADWHDSKTSSLDLPRLQPSIHVTHRRITKGAQSYPISVLGMRFAVTGHSSRTLSPAEKNYWLYSGKLDFLVLKWVVCEKYLFILQPTFYQ